MSQFKYFSLLRRIVTVLLVLAMLVACSAQVRAEGLPAVPDESGLTQEQFSAVAVQLSAVARAEGRASADQMLYSAFDAAAALQVSESLPAAASESHVNVIVVPEKKAAPTFQQLLPYLAAVILVAAVMRSALRRKASRGVVYKPLRANSAQRNPYAGYGLVRTSR